MLLLSKAVFLHVGQDVYQKHIGNKGNMPETYRNCAMHKSAHVRFTFSKMVKRVGSVRRGYFYI